MVFENIINQNQHALCSITLLKSSEASPSETHIVTSGNEMSKYLTYLAV